MMHHALIAILLLAPAVNSFASDDAPGTDIETATPVPAPSLPERPGVYFAGVGSGNPKIFQFAHIQLLNFIAEHGVPIANFPTTIKESWGDEAALPYVLEFIRSSSSNPLLYMNLRAGVFGTMEKDRIVISCFDTNGKLRWKEEATNLFGNSPIASMRKTVAKITKKVRPRIGGPCLISQ